MAIDIKHQFQSAKGDGADPTQVQPSHWNQSHDIEVPTGVVLGRLSVGTGALEELPATAYGAGLLNAADAAALKALIGKIALADMADLATARIIGRATAGTGEPESLTITQILDMLTGVAQGAVAFRGAAAWEKLAAGTLGQFLQTRGPGQNPVWATVEPMVHMQEIQAAGVASTSTNAAGSYQTVALNTVSVNEVAGAALAANQISLPAGTYYVEAKAPVYNCNSYQSRLQDITNTVTLVQGRSGRTATVGAAQTAVADLNGQFVLAGTTTIQLQSYIGVAGARGIATGLSGNEIFGDVVIRKRL